MSWSESSEVSLSEVVMSFGPLSAAAAKSDIVAGLGGVDFAAKPIDGADLGGADFAAWPSGGTDICGNIAAAW